MPCPCTTALALALAPALAHTLGLAPAVLALAVPTPLHRLLMTRLGRPRQKKQKYRNVTLEKKFPPCQVGGA